ncbi:unnamed protein product [Mycena citricolor]|uniref:FCP1 homology domain-containing protein n=1 Tax=Mycena citricolor TaxID=2018698 RepID=A0AAD2HIS5_9AGAR|nr:unnamed protein product [Mycena citricolor]
MNSLSYLSRQFDALASAKTPPPTPAAENERGHYLDESRPRSESSSLPSAKSWSTKSFFLPPKDSRSSKSRLKRSASSPADVIALASERPQPSSASAAVSTTSHDTAPTVIYLEAVLRRTFIVRVLVLTWNALRAALASVTGHAGFLRRRRVAVLESELRVLENDSGDEEPPARVPSVAPPPLPRPSNPTAAADDTSPAVSTPSMHTARRTPFLLPKTLVLDLDETLIHSTSRPMQSGSSGFLSLGRSNSSAIMVEVVLGDHSTVYHVHKRPFVDFFLRTVSGWYTLVIFTASVQEYANPVIDWLDAGRGILVHRFYRDSCTQLPNGSFTKDLSVVDSDLSRVCIVDNSPISYRVNEANGIPIEGWTHDPSDEALLDLLPVLDSLRFTSDVRRVLGLRTAGGIS